MIGSHFTYGDDQAHDGAYGPSSPCSQGVWLQIAGFRLRILLLKLIPGALFAVVGLIASARASNPPDPRPPTSA